MSKILAVMIAGLFAAGAYAQNPTGTTPEQGNATNSKPQARAEAKKEAKPAGQVAAPAGRRLRRRRRQQPGAGRGQYAPEADRGAERRLDPGRRQDARRRRHRHRQGRCIRRKAR